MIKTEEVISAAEVFGTAKLARMLQVSITFIKRLHDLADEGDSLPFENVRKGTSVVIAEIERIVAAE